MKITVRREGDLLAPVLPSDIEALENIKQGQLVTVELKRSRNLKFHAKFFALIQIVVDNTDYLNSEEVLHLLKLKLGHYDTIVNTNGKYIYKPKSISFGKMDQDTFNRFYNLSVDVILRDFLTNWEDDDIQAAIDEVVRF